MEDHMSRWLYALLLFSVLAVILSFLQLPALLLFVVAGLGIIPLAALIGQSVEDVAEHTGERIGGLLFATFGNATELIIGILALSKGLVDVVSASIIGSILGNLLLVLGIAVCVGSFKHGRLPFEVRPASQYASLFALCIAGLLLPTVAELLAVRSHQTQIFEHGVVLSDFIAVLLLLGYLASILFSVFRIGDREPENPQGEQRSAGDEDFDPVLGARSTAAVIRLLAYRHHLRKSTLPGRTDVLKKIDGAVDAIVAHETHLQTDAPLTAPAAQIAVPEQKKPSLWRALLLLIVATVGVGILSEILVGTIEPMAEVLGWNTAFVGLIFLPLIGNIPEYFNTIGMALDKRIGMVLAASAGSSIQIALLVAPILVLVSLAMPARLDLVFSIVELAVLAIATFLYSEITRDGELVWLEGLLLILLYTMMGGTVFLFGSGKI
jgi:Ca2+:H+ antiporter